MKLLSQTQVTQTKDEQLNSELEKGAKIAALVDSEKRELDRLRKGKVDEIEKLENDFAEFVLAIQAKKRTLEAEVVPLEERKLKALEPIETLRVAMEAQKASFDALQANFEAQEAAVRQKETQLVGEMEAIAKIQKEMVSERERFDFKLLNLKAQENAIKDTSRQLQENWDEFIKANEQSQTKITDWQYRVEERQKAIGVLQGEIASQRTDIEANRTKLVDLQQTIKAAFDEARAANLL
jgi:chromosome segregation ATPase